MSLFERDEQKKKRINEILRTRLGIEGEVDCLDNLQTAVRKHSSGLSEDTDLTLGDLLLFLTLVLQINKTFPPEEINITEQQKTEAEKRIKDVFSGTKSGGSKLKKSKTNKKKFKKSSKKLRTRIKKGYLKTLKNRHNFKKGQKKTLKSKKGGSRGLTGFLAAATAASGALQTTTLGASDLERTLPTSISPLERTRTDLPPHVLSSHVLSSHDLSSKDFDTGVGQPLQINHGEDHRMEQAQTRRTGNDFKDELVSRIEAAIKYNPKLSTSEAARLVLLNPGQPGFIPTETWIAEQNKRGEEERLRHVVADWKAGSMGKASFVHIWELPTEDRLKIYTSKSQTIGDVNYDINIEKDSSGEDDFVAKFTNDNDNRTYSLNLKLIGKGVDKITFSLIKDDSPGNPISEKLKGKVIKFHTEASVSLFGENVLSENLKSDLVSKGLLIADENLSENISVADMVTPLNEEQQKEIEMAMETLDDGSIYSEEMNELAMNGQMAELVTKGLSKFISDYINYIPYLARIRCFIDEYKKNEYARLAPQFYSKVAIISVMGGQPIDVHGGNWGLTDDGRLKVIDVESFQDLPRIISFSPEGERIEMDNTERNLENALNNINLAFLLERNIFSLIYSLLNVEQLNYNQCVTIFFSLYKLWTIKKSIQRRSKLLAFLDAIIPASNNFSLHMLRIFGTLIKGLARITIKKLRGIVVYLIAKGSRVFTGVQEPGIGSEFLEIEEQVDSALIDNVIDAEQSLLTRVDQCLPGANMYLLKDIKYNDKGEYSESESGAHEVTSGQRIIIEDFDDIDNTVKISIPTSPPTRITGVPSNLYKKLKIGDQVVNDGITLTVIREEEIPELEEMRYTITIGPKTGEYGTLKEVSPNDIKLVTSDS